MLNLHKRILSTRKQHVLDSCSNYIDVLNVHKHWILFIPPDIQNMPPYSWYYDVSLFCRISIKIKESQSVCIVYSVFDKETKIHFQVSAVCDMLKTTFISLILVLVDGYDIPRC